MTAMLTADGKIAITTELRQDAQLQPGDTLEVRPHQGTIPLRQHEPLTPAQWKEHSLWLASAIGFGQNMDA